MGNGWVGPRLQRHQRGHRVFHRVLDVSKAMFPRVLVGGLWGKLVVMLLKSWPSTTTVENFLQKTLKNSKQKISLSLSLSIYMYIYIYIENPPSWRKSAQGNVVFWGPFCFSCYSSFKEVTFCTSRFYLFKQHRWFTGSFFFSEGMNAAFHTAFPGWYQPVMSDPSMEHEFSCCDGGAFSF